MWYARFLYTFSALVLEFQASMRFHIKHLPKLYVQSVLKRSSKISVKKLKLCIHTNGGMGAILFKTVLSVQDIV